LEALVERPELRVFKRDALEHAAGNRGAYVAAALTIVRAYYAAGRPMQSLPPLGSYAEWSRMVREPLVWLGEPDPVACTDATHDEDPEVSNIREFFALWLSYDLGLDTPYTSGRIIEIACAQPAPNDFNPRTFEQFLLQVAATKGNEKVVSATRLGWWLRRISGRVVAGHRLIQSRQRNVSAFQLSRVVPS
jgi:hypothetical protein